MMTQVNMKVAHPAVSHLASRILFCWTLIFFCITGTTAKADTTDYWKFSLHSRLDDSARVRHILIAYKGAERSNATCSREEAHKLADSVAQLARSGKSWKDLYLKYSSDPGGLQADQTGKLLYPYGDYGWLNTRDGFGSMFVACYMDFALEYDKDDIEVVESEFGYHVMQKLESSKTKSSQQRILRDNGFARIQRSDSIVFMYVSDTPVSSAVEVIDVLDNDGKKIASFSGKAGDPTVVISCGKLFDWMTKKHLQETMILFSSRQVVPSTQVQFARKERTLLHLKAVL